MDDELETIYQSESSTLSGMESGALKNVLEANGIVCVVVGDSVLPNLGFEVRVERKHAAEAKRIIAEALAAGPAAAEEGERQYEEGA